MRGDAPLEIGQLTLLMAEYGTTVITLEEYLIVIIWSVVHFNGA